MLKEKARFNSTFDQTIDLNVIQNLAKTKPNLKVMTQRNLVKYK